MVTSVLPLNFHILKIENYLFDKAVSISESRQAPNAAPPIQWVFRKCELNWNGRNTNGTVGVLWGVCHQQSALASKSPFEQWERTGLLLERWGKRASLWPLRPDCLHANPTVTVVWPWADYSVLWLCVLEFSSVNMDKNTTYLIRCYKCSVVVSVESSVSRWELVRWWLCEWGAASVFLLHSGGKHIKCRLQ